MYCRSLGLILALSILGIARAWAGNDDCCCNCGGGCGSCSCGAEAAPMEQACKVGCGCDSCKVGCDGDGCAAPTWTVGIDLLALQPTAKQVMLGETFNVASGTPIDQLSSTDGDSALEPGMRLRLVFHSCEGDSLEAVYYGLQFWSGGRTLMPNVAGGALAFSSFLQTDQPGSGIGGFDTSLGFQFASRLNNVEFNYRTPEPGPGDWSLDLLAGVRYVQWDEALSLTGVDSFAGTEKVDIDCHNQLVGPQIGGQIQHSWDRFQLSLEGKAGLMLNCFQIRRSNLSSSGVTGGNVAIVPIDDGVHDYDVAGVVDLSVTGSFRLPSHLAARGGYQMLFLGSLANAAQQFGGGFDHGGSALLYGPSIGMDVSW